MCGIDEPLLFTTIATYPLDKAEYIVQCLGDNIMQVIEGTYSSFIGSYSSSMLGHILLVFGMLMERDDNNQAYGGDLYKSENVSHLLGYFFLIINIAVEMALMRYLTLPDPETLFAGATYEGCDASAVVEISDTVQMLLNFAFNVTILRCVFTSFLILCYYKSHPSNKEVKIENKVKPDDIKNEPGMELSSVSV